MTYQQIAPTARSLIRLENSMNPLEEHEFAESCTQGWRIHDCLLKSAACAVKSPQAASCRLLSVPALQSMENWHAVATFQKQCHAKVHLCFMISDLATAQKPSRQCCCKAPIHPQQYWQHSRVLQAKSSLPIMHSYGSWSNCILYYTISSPHVHH